MSRTGVQVFLASAAILVLLPAAGFAQCGHTYFTSCPNNFTVKACLQEDGSIGAIVEFATPTAENDCGSVEPYQVQGLPSGYLFPPGATDIEWTTPLDEYNNQTTCDFTVFVEWDPQLTYCPRDTMIEGCRDFGSVFATVNYDPPTMEDSCGPVPMVLDQGYLPGSTFPVGTTTVVWREQHPYGQPIICEFDVEVVYHPTVVGCRDTTVYVCPGESGAPVAYTPPTGYDDCGPVDVYRLDGPGPDGFFDVGSTRVEWGVDDGNGSYTTCDFLVRVEERDDTPPEITCPADVSVTAEPGEDGAEVEFVVSASDDCGLKSLVCTPPSGTRFECGVTTVTCVATDLSNNTTSCSFDVIVATPVALDVKPRSCPNSLKTTEQGLITVAIVGTEDFDVTEVDPASVKLEGVPAEKWSLADVTGPYTPITGKTDCMDCNSVNKDKMMDLVLKFPVPALMAALGPVSTGDCRVVHLSGDLASGCPIVGEDVVRIVSATTASLGSAEADFIPGTFALHANLPNPFSAQTHIRFSLPEAGHVRLVVYDIQGRMVKLIEDDDRPAGIHDAIWDGRSQNGGRVPGGVYFYRLIVNGFGGANEVYTEERKMVLQP